MLYTYPEQGFVTIAVLKPITAHGGQQHTFGGEALRSSNAETGLEFQIGVWVFMVAYEDT